LYEDQLAALERDSKRVGHAGEEIDYALLLDGLKAEREQGITIDVAYRYFQHQQTQIYYCRLPGARTVHPQHGNRRSQPPILPLFLSMQPKGLLPKHAATPIWFRCWE
jgi:translation elongation factor EF-1alpha